MIEAQSYESDGTRWRPHAVVIIHVSRNIREHHESALPDVMCDTEQDANAYAVAMAKKWIDDHANRTSERTSNFALRRPLRRRLKSGVVCTPF